MIEFLQSAGAIWGFGAVFAVLMFFILMRIMKYYTSQMREDRKYMEDRLSGILAAYDNSTKENTQVLSQLFQYLKGKNGNK